MTYTNGISRSGNESVKTEENGSSGTQRVAPDLENCSYRPDLKWIFLKHWVQQTPWRVCKFVWAFLYTLIALLFWLREPEDKDIIKFIEMTSLGLLVYPVDGEELVFALTVKQCRLKLPTGPISSLSITYSKHNPDKHQILNFKLNGTKSENRQLIMSVIFSYLSTGMHAKSHLFSNNLTNYILENDLRILMPSTITSMPLHNALLKSPMSVISEHEGWYYWLIGRFYSHPSLRPSVQEEAKNFSVLQDHPKRVDRAESPSEYVRYLAAARDIMRQVIINHDLPLHLLSPLFNHIIVHSTEHHNIWFYARFRYGSIVEDRACTNFEAFRTICFIMMFAKPTTSPLFPNKIRYIKNSFYQELYLRLKELDKQFDCDYADDINASIMY